MMVEHESTVADGAWCDPAEPGWVQTSGDDCSTGGQHCYVA